MKLKLGKIDGKVYKNKKNGQITISVNKKKTPKKTMKLLTKKVKW